MTEQQPYQVVASHPGFEVRHYPEHLVAEVTVGGSFEGVGNRAFGALAGYIGGRNRAQAKVAMTAPVVQRAGSDPGSYVVSFVMPARFTRETIPEPSDPRVRIVVVPEQDAVAARFSGRWTRASYEEHRDLLLAEATAAGFEVVGPERWLRYDPPWTPWFLRRQEVVAPVVRSAAAHGT